MKTFNKLAIASLAVLAIGCGEDRSGSYHGTLQETQSLGGTTSQQVTANLTEGSGNQMSINIVSPNGTSIQATAERNGDNLENLTINYTSSFNFDPNNQDGNPFNQGASATIQGSGYADGTSLNLHGSGNLTNTAFGGGGPFGGANQNINLTFTGTKSGEGGE